MREVINISSSMVKTVKLAVKAGFYSSIGEFFRYLPREWQESQLLKKLNKSRAEIAAGNGCCFKFFKDLRKLTDSRYL